MSAFLKKLLEGFIYDKWYERYMGLVFPCLIFISTCSLLIGPDVSDVSITKLVYPMLFSIIGFVLWRVTTRIKKHPENVIGFDLAIYCDSKDQSQRIEADFVSSLKSSLKNGTREQPFHLISHPNPRASKLVDKKEVRKLLDKTKGIFILYGNAKLRNIDGEEKHVLELNIGVRHAATNDKVRNFLSEEMQDAIAGDNIISKQNDIFQFRVIAGQVDITARYTVALAALISGDFNYAIEQFKWIENEFKKLRSIECKELIKIKTRLPDRIAEAYLAKIHRLYSAYYIKPEKGTLIQLEKELDAANVYAPKWNNGYQLRAITGFLLRRDVTGCWEMVEKCKKQGRDTTWNYSAAFLKAYEGDLNESWQYYQKVFNQPPPDPTVPIQTESFIRQVLSEEVEKYQLWYCLGLINYKAKEDYVIARRDFIKFLELCDEGIFVSQKKLAEDYVRKIDSMACLELDSVNWVE